MQASGAMPRVRALTCGACLLLLLAFDLCCHLLAATPAGARGSFTIVAGRAEGGEVAVAPSTRSGPAGGVLSYVHLWTSADGETHLADCAVKDMTVQTLPGGKSAQYVRNLADTVSGLNATNVIVTQQLGPNPWHHCPQTQFVVTLSGTWFVNATDGDQRHLPPGTWLFQDDSPKHPAAERGTRKAMHYSEAVGPCNQMVLQWERLPVIGHPCPF